MNGAPAADRPFELEGKLSMTTRILITGGAGFIGSHCADAFLSGGYRVRVLDNLTPQVHGELDGPPDYLTPDVEFIRGDVRNPEDLDRALRDVDKVLHLAAAVGVGQSMYEIAHYSDVNTVGTAKLLEALLRRPVENLVVASSMSIYGEGLYRKPSGGYSQNASRNPDQLRKGEWEVFSEDGERLLPVGTPESKHPDLSSVYALTKYDQERLVMMFGRAYDVPVTALRFFNVYGTRQALSNPYTGVLAIFASRYLNGNPPLIFEDGRQMRDFVSVHDIAQACRRALESSSAAGEVFNIGSGEAKSVRTIADQMAHVLDKPHLEPVLSGKYRVGDIRHCFADISKAQRILEYSPRIKLEQGLIELAQWLETQVAHDQVETATAQLSERGLTI